MDPWRLAARTAGGFRLMGRQEMDRIVFVGSSYGVRLRCAAGSQVDDEPVVGGLEGNFMEVVEHVGGHVGDDDALGGEVVSVGGQVGVAKVMGDVLVRVVRLGDEQVRACGGIGKR